MISQYIAPPSRLVAIPSGGGYQSRFWALPLAVLCVGVLGSSFLLKVMVLPGRAEKPNLAAQKGNIQQNLLLSPVFTPEVQFWGADILKWAQAAGLDPNLVATVMQIESCGDPHALSRSGAMGLFQVMPYHFTTSDDPYTPDTNALRGLDYLRRSWEAARGEVRLALAGYNGGIGVIGWSEADWPDQTQHYAYWGSGIYTEASAGTQTSSRLQEWLNANGVALCRQANTRLGIDP